ncbi:MAG: nuclear transport factor 2 family protein [Candidatus Binatia bacterium]
MAQDLEARIQALEGAVQNLDDHEAIRTLRCRYHECINEKKFADILDLFTEDGDLDFGYLGKARGRAELTTFFVEKVPGLLSFVKQFVHNHVIHVQGDHGTGLSYLEAKSVAKGESYLVAARYDDDYVKQNGQWKFKRMHLTPYFTVPLREGWAQEDRLKMGR